MKVAFVVLAVVLLAACLALCPAAASTAYSRPNCNWNWLWTINDYELIDEIVYAGGEGDEYCIAGLGIDLGDGDYEEWQEYGMDNGVVPSGATITQISLWARISLYHGDIQPGIYIGGQWHVMTEGNDNGLWKWPWPLPYGPWEWARYTITGSWTGLQWDSGGIKFMAGLDEDDAEVLVDVAYCELTYN